MTRTTLAISLAVLAVSGSLPATVPGAGRAPAQAATKTYVHSFINGPESPLRIRPRTIRVEGSGAVSYSRLRWSTWGSSTARAMGRQCSARTGACQTASIRLSDRETIRGRRVYTCLRPLLRGEVKICLP